MPSKIFISLSLLLSFSLSFAETQWLEFNAGCPDNSEPLVQFGTSDKELILFDVELRGLLAETLTVDSVDYLRFNKTPGTVPFGSTGFPELPIVRCFVWVPDSTDLSVNCITNCSDTRNILPVYPAPLDSIPVDYARTGIMEYFRKDSTAYALDSWYPDTLVRLTGDFYLRDIRIAVVDIYPVQYLPSEDSLRVWSDMEVFIKLEDETATWSTSNLGPYERLIRDNLLGYKPDMTPEAPEPGSVERPLNLTTGPHNTPDYVILTAAGLDGSWIDTLAWHRADLNNFDVSIVRTDSVLSQFGQSASILTSDIIRDFTETMWGWGENMRPSYLLLIGDHEDADSTNCDWFLPTRTSLSPVSTIYHIGNDEWYVYFDESSSVFNAFPDMIVGRLSTRETDNLADMIEVIRDYEAASSWPPPDSLAWRRIMTRLGGTDHEGSFTEDRWYPSVGWTDSLRQWCNYDWDNYYCGDGFDTTTTDGSTFSSHAWVDTCISVFERGQQIAFYSDHGVEHMLSAGLYWEERPPVLDFGLPDSAFNDLHVRELCSEINIIHGHPFLLLLCCSSGTFNHTFAQHYDSVECATPSLCFSDTSHYDFGVDCLAEEFIRNTEGGAIGVYSSSLSSGIDYYDSHGRGIISSILYYGITRTGDAIQACRLTYLDSFMVPEYEFAKYNLMGDPAIDTGDRVKFRNRCDIILSPADISWPRYITRPLSGDPVGNEIPVIVRNAGAVASGVFDVDLIISETDGSYADTSHLRCPGLAAGAEDTLMFKWIVPQTMNSPVDISFQAFADQEHTCSESWIHNNNAEVITEILDFYPNDTDWPLQLPGSIKSPPVLADLDGDGDLEIVVLYTGSYLAAYDPADNSEAIWTAGPYDNLSAYTIFASGNVSGSARPEIVFETLENLLVLDGQTGNEIYNLNLNIYPDVNFYRKTTTLVDIDSSVNDHKEIVFLRNDSLYIFGESDGSLTMLDREYIPSALPEEEEQQDETVQTTWVCASDITGSSVPDLLLSCSFIHPISQPPFYEYLSSVYIYDYDFLKCVDSLIFEDELFRAIPAIGSLPGSGMNIAISRRTSSANHAPAYILDTDLTLQDSCAHNPSLNSNNVLCCLMADWVTGAGVDRILSPAENQCFAWRPNGEHEDGWPAMYAEYGSSDPPFPALSDLDDDGWDDVVVATRQGFVMAYDLEGNPLYDLQFPYTMLASIYGGFVTADIDNDEKIELVFGTMDNYLHVWELGDCDRAYAPWPQCQHDAARTGIPE